MKLARDREKGGKGKAKGRKGSIKSVERSKLRTNDSKQLKKNSINYRQSLFNGSCSTRRRLQEVLFFNIISLVGEQSRAERSGAEQQEQINKLNWFFVSARGV